VIRILLGPRLIRSARKLTPETRAKVEASLSAVAAQFGDPHQHSGLGLRKLGRGLWECRVDIRWRIVFLQEPDRLRAFDIMNHDELRAWLKTRND
jgi:hypothetical protein